MPFDFTPYNLYAMPGEYAEIHDLATTDDRVRIVAVVNGLLEHDEQIAFTHLFAAAPELLAAAKVALAFLENTHQDQLIVSVLRRSHRPNGARRMMDVVASTDLRAAAEAADDLIVYINATLWDQIEIDLQRRINAVLDQLRTACIASERNNHECQKVYTIQDQNHPARR